MPIEDNSYEVVLYVKQSQAFIAPWHWKEEMKRSLKEMGTWSGHAFIGLRNPMLGIREELYGFGGAKGYEEYKADYPDEKITDAVLPGKVISGIVVGEYGERVPDEGTIGADYNRKVSPHDARVVYKVSKKQFDAVKQFIAENKANPPGYNLFGYNCVHFAFEALQTANLQPPTKMPILYTPTVASWNIEKMKMVENIKDKMNSVREKLSEYFSPDRPLAKQIVDGSVIPYSFKDIRAERSPDSEKDPQSSLGAGILKKRLSRR